MPYAYKVRDPLGNTLTGNIDAVSEEEATQQLRRDGFTVVELEELGGLNFGGGRIRKDELIYMTTQLAIMVDTGVPLASAMDSILQQEKNQALKRVLKQLKEAVEGGESFSSALARHPKVFDHTYVSLIKASEETGKLAEMLERIALYLRKELELRSKVKAALAYPVVMMSIAVGVTIFLITWVLPRFTPLFNRKGMKLPKPTVILMALSDSLLNYWYLWALGAVAAAAVCYYGPRTEGGRLFWDSLKLKLPVVGTLFKKVTISRSIRTLGSMLSGGVPMLDALGLCREVSGNALYQQLWTRVLDDVTSGKRICDTLTGTDLMPPTLVQMIRAGEDTANLGPILERVSNYYDIEVENSVKAATSMIEPLMIAVMGLVVGGIGLSLLLPIFSLSSAH